VGFLLDGWETGDQWLSPAPPSSAQIGGMIPQLDPRFNQGRWWEVISERDAKQHQDGDRVEGANAVRKAARGN
jgi:hypothetical protein